MNVRSGLADRLGLARIGLASVVAQEKHERLSDAFADHTAEGSPIHVDARLAPGIIVAELEGCCTAERVAEHSNPLHIETSQEPARGVGTVQSFELIECKAHVGAPCLDQLIGEMLLFLPAEEIGVVLRRPRDHPSVGEHHHETSIRCIEAHNHVAMTRQVFGKGRIVRRQGRKSRSREYHWIRTLLRRNFGVTNTMRADARQVSCQELRERHAKLAFKSDPPGSRQVVVDRL